jgi:transposase
MDITTIGVDLAKRVFAVHGVDHYGKTVLRKTLRREQMLPFFTRLQPCSWPWKRAAARITGRASWPPWDMRRS